MGERGIQDRRNAAPAADGKQGLKRTFADGIRARQVRVPVMPNLPRFPGFPSFNGR
jgi:hypothetical protein